MLYPIQNHVRNKLDISGIWDFKTDPNCYINAYHSKPEIIKQVDDKIMGESEFKGQPNDLVWAEKWQAKL